VSTADPVVELVLCALCVVALIYWRMARRRRRCEPSWRDDELPPPIARRCRKIFRSHGIEASVSGDVTLFDSLILGGQFPQRPGAIAIVCRSRNFLVGETLFMRIHESALKVPDWTVMLVVTIPITNELNYLGKAYGIPVLDITEIRCFAAALGDLKAGRMRDYLGRSLLIRQFLKRKFAT
jgi:hypothetical protein